MKKHDPSNDETTVFVYDATGKLIAEYDTTIQTGTDAKIAYTTTDELKTPRINTDDAGNVIARHDYHPFGEEISTAERTLGVGYTSDTIRKKFTGYEGDVETGLVFAQARYFNSGHGRFSSPDPLAASAKAANPQTLNRYSYAVNSPYRFSDPSGMIPVENRSLYDDIQREISKAYDSAWQASSLIDRDSFPRSRSEDKPDSRRLEPTFPKGGHVNLPINIDAEVVITTPITIGQEKDEEGNYVLTSKASIGVEFRVGGQTIVPSSVETFSRFSRPGAAYFPRGPRQPDASGRFQIDTATLDPDDTNETTLYYRVDVTFGRRTTTVELTIDTNGRDTVLPGSVNPSFVTIPFAWQR